MTSKVVSGEQRKMCYKLNGMHSRISRPYGMEFLKKINSMEDGFHGCIRGEPNQPEGEVLDR